MFGIYINLMVIFRYFKAKFYKAEFYQGKFYRVVQDD